MTTSSLFSSLLAPEGLRVRVQIERIKYDYARVSGLLREAGLVSPSAAVSGDPLCVKMPCWTANAQITPLAHYMQVLSYQDVHGKLEKVFHTNENRSFPGVDKMLGAVAACPDLIFKLRDCFSQKQRTRTEMVCEESQIYFLKEGMILSNPPRNLKSKTLKDEFLSFPGVEERHCKFVIVHPSSAHKKFKERNNINELEYFSNIHTKSLFPQDNILWSMEV